MARQALGKGLGALIKKRVGIEEGPPAEELSEAPDSASGQEVRQVSIDSVVPSPLQPRNNIPDEQLDELLESIRQHGVIQPLIVRAVNGKLELIAGERRWRASAKLGIATVPVIQREATDREVLEMALIENLQRQDLNPIEEGAGYIRLAREFEMKQEDIAKSVGKSRAAVANSMRLLDLPDDLQGFLAKGQLSVGHAKAILGIKNEKSQRAAANEVLRRKLTVRATEKLVHDFHNESSTRKVAKAGSSLDRETETLIRQITSRVRDRFTTHATINHSAKKGRIELEYYGNDDLQRVLELMGVDMKEL
jgi:ParB family chromosome partitioning protein